MDFSYVQNPSSMSSPGLEAPLVVNMPFMSQLSITFPPIIIVTLRVQFHQANVYAQSPMTFSVKIRSNFPMPLRFTSLKVLFSDSSYNQEIVDPLSASIYGNTMLSDFDSTVTGDDDRSLLFEHDGIYVHTFEFVSKQLMELKVLFFCYLQISVPL